ncbi:non-ribosomal peptide synthetase [Streptosporangium saharense]|uniref:non-ribosomal peptide synthetase n=1 Tax=Streptosporangium saharense TaxID=1706840 RepID=UPI0016078EEA|nr:non-ribosomal peptide synthetase [Streptosporangium saharense]
MSRKAEWESLLAVRAKEHPDRPAVVGPRLTLSYEALDRRTAVLAGSLRGHRVGPGQVVAVRAQDPVNGLVALLAVLRVGATHLALDPTAPEDRDRFILRDSATRLVLSDETDDDTWNLQPEGTEHEGAHAAYLVYTSGTTGRPKGVSVSYGALGEHLAGITERFGLREDDRVLRFAPPYVDVAVEQALAPLTVGATVVFGAERAPAIGDLLDLLRRERVTVANLPAGYWNELALGLDRTRLPEGHSLRLMISGSERMSPRAARAWLRHAPGVRLLNAYGPTECVVTATVHEVTEVVTDEIPIGTACGDRTLHVLDPESVPCPPGVAGELHIGGSPLALGYPGRPGLTAQRFVPDPYGAPGARMYRTGDLVRLDADGNLVFLGRTDDQVKIRGHRVEPAETQRVLEGHPAVRRCAVIGQHDEDGRTRLVGYVVTETPNTGELTAFLAERLPAYLLPAHLVPLDRLPLTEGGKLDRDALPPIPRGPAHSAGEPPRTETERLLADLWREVLGVETIGRGDDFFALGGDSLAALRITARLFGHFGKGLSPQAVFDTPVLSDLATRLDAERAPQQPSPERTPYEENEKDRPLSLGQHALWLAEQWNPGAPLYNVPWLFRLRGPVDVPALEHSLTALVERHEALRTVFPATLGEPEQVVLSPFPVLLGVEDHSEEVVAREARRPFDLEHGPLFRTLLLRDGEDGWALLVVLHHIVWDEWSLGVFETELAELYAAHLADRSPQLADLPTRPRDHAVRQRRLALDEGLAYWERRLDGAPRELALPADRAAGERTPSGAAVRFDLGADLAERVRDLARAEGATPFMVLLAAFCLMLRGRTGQEDLVVATPVADREHDEEGLIGYFVNLVPLRVRARTDVGFRELLGRVREDVLADLGHQDVPFQLLLDRVARDHSGERAAFAQVAFEMHRHNARPVRLGEADGTRELVPTGTSKFDLTWQITDDGERIFGVVEYSTDLFDAATVEGLTTGWRDALREAVELPVHEVFERRVREHPDRVALTEVDGVSLTYGELNVAANRLAHALNAHGVNPGDLVGLHLAHGASYVIALLAVLKAGAGYVPLEPGLPSARLTLMATEPDLSVILTTQPWTLTDTPVMDLTDLAAHPDTNPAHPADPERVFYIPYTSGSTGHPKGTLVPHRAIPGFFTNVSYATWGPEAVTLLHSALSWDGNLVEILPPLLTGGRIVIHTGPNRDPLSVAETAQAHNVTHLFLPTVAFNTIITTNPHHLAGIKYLMFGGEAVTVRHVHTALTELPDTRLIHCYGPSECTVFATAHPVTAADLNRPTIPIGTPIGDRTVHLIDVETGLLVTEPGEPGEVCISGPSLAHGYLNRPTLTATAFRPYANGRLYRTGDLATYTPDGLLLFQRRTDTQHKIRGYRIELTEIENVLTTHPHITHAAVTTHPDPTGTLRLTAYLTTAENLTATDIRTHLTPHLPDYMIPTTYLTLPALPTTHNGKTDRAALPPPHTLTPLPTGQEAVAETDPLHRTLTGIWERVLGLASVGAEDDVFELGAHSFAIAKVKARVAVALRIDLPPRVFFTARTVAEQAAVLLEKASSPQAVLRRAEAVAALPELDDHEWAAAVADITDGED